MSNSSGKVLDTLYEDVRRSFVEDRTIMSFREYFDLVCEQPERQLRSSAQYIVDMLDHYGRETREHPTGNITRFKVFDAEFAGGEGRVAGQELVQTEIYRILANFAREGRVNKLILLHGPNGSAKSSIVRGLMSGLEAYSRLAEGAAYTFNWIFPSSRLEGTNIGFGASKEMPAAAKDSYAYLPPESIDARVPCGMNDHPVFLVPQSQRVDLLKSLLPEPDARLYENDDAVARPSTTISDYLRLGDLSQKSRMIYDALLASYDGDIRKVLNHVQVERIYLSRRYRRGCATIEPQMSVDARIHQVTADRTLATLPKSLQQLNLFEPTGPLVDANRGLLEFSDLLKRPVEAFKYLLSTVETANVSMDSFMLHLDMVYIASTNETYLDAFKEHPDFPSFKGRMELVKVPYLLRYSDERSIYEQITPRMVGRHIAPHAIEVAALWATLTRMRRSDPTRYPKEISDVIDSLTPMEKLLLYDDGEIPERLTTRGAKELRHTIRDIYRESLGYPNYEGRFGASAREVRTMLLNAAHNPDYKCLSPLAVFREIEHLLGAKSEYEFLRQEVVGKFHDHESFLQHTRELFTDWIDDEIREAMGLTTESSYLELLSRYINHTSHWVKKERLQDAQGDWVHPDEKFMGEIESVLMSEGEKPEDFRKSVIGSIGARALETPGEQAPDYAILFKGYINKLREDFYAKRKKVLLRINQNFLKYTSDERSALEPKELAQVEAMLERLETQYGYNEHSARDAVAYLLKTRYAE